MNLEAIYSNLGRHADPASVLRVMSNGTLAALAAHHTDSAVPSGIPALILGMAETEAATRWITEHTHSPGAVGEG